MTKKEVLNFISSEGLLSANRLFLNGEELADWACGEYSLLGLTINFEKTTDEYWLSEINRFKNNLIETIAAKLFDLSLSQSISYMENDTHCKIVTKPCIEDGKTNIDAEVIEAIVKNISDIVDEHKSRALSTIAGFNSPTEEMHNGI